MVRLDCAERRILLDDGTFLPYDRLLLATGAYYLLPPVPGLKEAENVYGFRDLSADGDRGIQRSHGILKYHGKQRAAELSHLFLAVICDVRVVDLYRACLDVCVFGDQFHDGPAEDTFSAAGFSDDGQSFSGFQRKRDVPKSFDLAVRSVETDR